MVGMTSMGSDSVQHNLKFFILLRQQLIPELSQGQSMLKDGKLIIIASLTKSLSLFFVGNKELKVVFFYCDWFDNNHGT
jgi:hypothetical protein